MTGPSRPKSKARLQPVDGARLQDWPLVSSIRAMVQDRKARRMFLILTLPALLAQLLVWSWMNWSLDWLLP